MAVKNWKEAALAPSDYNNPDQIYWTRQLEAAGQRARVTALQARQGQMTVLPDTGLE